MAKGVRVIQWGVGVFGSSIARVVLEKEGMEIVGAIDVDPQKTGKDLGDVVGLNRSLGVAVSDNPEVILAQGNADIILLATLSFAGEVYPQIEMAIKAGSNVITTAEEMGYLKAQHPDLAVQLDSLARENGVTVLGTGCNPGFAMDTLVIVLTGICTNVKKIKVERTNDMGAYGPVVMEAMGIGKTREEFEQGLREGTIPGHVGYPESIRMIADSLGIPLNEIKQIKEPVISETRRNTPFMEILPGRVAGCKEVAQGIKNGKVFIEFEQVQLIDPASAGIEVKDSIHIEGTPNIEETIKGGIPGTIATTAMIVNMIPHVLNAAPGLVTMKDLPLPSAFMSDISGYLYNYQGEKS